MIITFTGGIKMEREFWGAAGYQEYFGDRSVAQAQHSARDSLAYSSQQALSQFLVQKLEYRKDHFFSLPGFYTITQVEQLS